MDEKHPLAYGYMGMHGWKHVNRAIQSADLLIAIGMRFDDRVTGSVRTYAPYARIIHADIDPAEIGKNVAVEVPIVGDAKHVLAGLTRLVHEVDPATRADYVAQLAEWRRGLRGQLVARLGRLARRPAVRGLRRGADRRADRPRRDLRRGRRPEPDVARPLHEVPPAATATSARAASGTMGFAVPAAMGAALGNPDVETWAIAGDGGFQMTSQELMTLAADRIPVKIALLDNHKLGMIRQWQEIIYAGNYHSSHLPGPDFVKLAEAYGIPAFRATRTEEVDAVDQGRAGGRRSGAHLVRDRRGAERVPDDAGGQGPVRPHRDVGGARGMSTDPSANGTEPHPAHATTPPPARSLPGSGEARRHILVVLVLDRPGVLNRVASLMRARNFNIDSLAVSRTDKEHISRMTLTLHGDDVAVEQAAKQLYRLVDVLKVQDVTEDQVVEHELALVKVRASDANRAEVIKIVELYKGSIVDISAESVIVEAHGTEAEIDALVALLRSYGIKELVRTGATVMLRGAGSIEEALKL